MAQTELDPSFRTYRRHARHPGQPEVLVGLVERVTFKMRRTAFEFYA